MKGGVLEGGVLGRPSTHPTGGERTWCAVHARMARSTRIAAAHTPPPPPLIVAVAAAVIVFVVVVVVVIVASTLLLLLLPLLILLIKCLHPPLGADGGRIMSVGVSDLDLRCTCLALHLLLQLRLSKTEQWLVPKLKLLPQLLIVEIGEQQLSKPPNGTRLV